MTALASLLGQTWNPWVLAITFGVEWWAIWFTLGRSARPTFLLTLAANAGTLSLALLLRFSGAVGSPVGSDPLSSTPGPGAWIVAWVFWLAIVFVLEALILRTCMRRWRPSFHWNPFDLGFFLAANAIGLLIAAAHLWWTSAR